MIRKVIDNKINDFSERFEMWQTNFVKLKSNILSYENKPLTKAVLDVIQYNIDLYIKENNININVFVYCVDDKIKIMGNTLEDELIWESIQNINQ